MVLGNPPWERIKLQEKEWFATRRPEIANAPNAAARRKMIDALRDEDAALYEAFLDDRRKAEGESHFVRGSDRYPLCGRGDVNTYTIFAETNRLLINRVGRVGCIMPSGIAFADTTKFFFSDLIEKGSLANLYSFVEIRHLFSDTDSREPFCLLTFIGKGRRGKFEADFVFFAHRVEDLMEEERHFSLNASDFALLNTNTHTCPIFRSKRDAELTKAIYARVPVLIDEQKPDGNPWSIQFIRMLDMANDSGLFRTRQQLETAGWQLDGNTFRHHGQRYVPLYEAKMLHHFTHRFGDYAVYPDGTATTQLPETPLERLQDPHYVVQPRYWVPDSAVEQRLSGKWGRGWLLGWRDITNSTNERTVIASVVPRVGVGHTFPLMFFTADSLRIVCLQANLSTLVFDFCARQKIGGTHLTYGYLNQLPVLQLSTYHQLSPWSPLYTLNQWITPRVLELTYTAYDLQPFAADCGYTGEPFRWDEERRFLLRCELDAAYFHLYGISRDDVEYILETFPIVKRKDERDYVEYRTQRIILEIYDAMQQAMKTGTAYRTRLNPPPAHGWTPSGSTLEAEAGHPGGQVREDAANVLAALQRLAATTPSQPAFPFSDAE